MAAQDQQASTQGLPDWLLIPVADIETLADKGELTGVAADIQAVLTRYSKATMAHDMESIESCFITNDDFLIVEGSYPNFGWDDFKKNHLVPELEGIEDIEHGTDLIQVYATGELAYTVFKYHAAGTRAGERRNMEGLGTAVLVPTDEGWKIRHWATCSRRPPMHSHG